MRRVLRATARELPVRVRDLAADFRDRRNPQPLPPAFLRRRVALDSSRSAFVDIGKHLSASIVSALKEAGAWSSELRDVLDFGCGAGRVARHMLAALPQASFAGVDVDREAIEWCRSHLSGSWEISPALPPIRLASEAFDLVYAVSVFSHFNEEQQDLWLSELNRLLRPGGFLVASTHSPALTFERPDLGEPAHRLLNERGFAFAAGQSSFNEASAFHSTSYLQEHWGQYFELVRHSTHGMAGYQDLTVFRKRTVA